MAYKIKGGRVEVKRNGDGWSALDKINFLAASPGRLKSVVPKTWEKMTDAGILIAGDDSGSDEESEPATVARGKKRADDDSSEEEAPTKGKAKEKTTKKKAKIWK